MALIPVYFTVAGMFPIDNSSATAIDPGTCLTLVADVNGDPQVRIADADDIVIGIAGDGYKLDSLTNPVNYAADIVINAQGDTTRSQDRINDLYKETLGSSLMTVYSGAGTFRTTTYVGSPDVGTKLYSNSVGKLTITNAGGSLVGHCVHAAKAYPSGVPGTDIEGSTSLGTYLTFNLLL